MLSAHYLEYIHDALIAMMWPGTEPVGSTDHRDRGLIESAAARPFHTVMGEDAYPSILEKGVALFHSINANHAFANGNKRTAVIALDHFLMANDYLLLLENNDMYRIAEATASYKARGLSLDESLSEIHEALEESVIETEIVRASMGPAFDSQKFFNQFTRIRDFIRAKGCVELL